MMIPKGAVVSLTDVIELIDNLVAFFGVQVTVNLHDHNLICVSESVGYCLGAYTQVYEHTGVAVAKVVQADARRDVILFLII